MVNAVEGSTQCKGPFSKIMAPLPPTLSISLSLSLSLSSNPSLLSYNSQPFGSLPLNDEILNAISNSLIVYDVAILRIGVLHYSKRFHRRFVAILTRKKKLKRKTHQKIKKK